MKNKHTLDTAVGLDMKNGVLSVVPPAPVSESECATSHIQHAHVQSLVTHVLSAKSG